MYVDRSLGVLLLQNVKKLYKDSCVSRTSCVKSDILPQAMSIVKFENEKKNGFVELQRSDITWPLSSAPHLYLRLAAQCYISCCSSITHLNLQLNCWWSSSIVSDVMPSFENP